MNIDPANSISVSYGFAGEWRPGRRPPKDPWRVLGSAHSTFDRCSECGPSIVDSGIEMEVASRIEAFLVK